MPSIYPRGEGEGESENHKAGHTNLRLLEENECHKEETSSSSLPINRFIVTVTFCGCVHSPLVTDRAQWFRPFRAVTWTTSRSQCEGDFAHHLQVLQCQRVTGCPRQTVSVCGEICFKRIEEQLYS
jgi:hypothetical protein